MSEDIARFEFILRRHCEGNATVDHVDEARDALEATIATLRADVEEMRRDAARYRWLRDLKCNSFSVGKDEDHASNYMTASDWIDENPDWYRDDDPAEVQRMRDTNTIWRLQVYPHTPVGFNVWNAATLDAAIDAAMEATKEKA